MAASVPQVFCCHQVEGISIYHDPRIKNPIHNFLNYFRNAYFSNHIRPSSAFTDIEQKLENSRNIVRLEEYVGANPQSKPRRYFIRDEQWSTTNPDFIEVSEELVEEMGGEHKWRTHVMYLKFNCDLHPLSKYVGFIMSILPEASDEGDGDGDGDDDSNAPTVTPGSAGGN